jgi:hypothetical protein
MASIRLRDGTVEVGLPPATREVTIGVYVPDRDRGGVNLAVDLDLVSQ